MLGNGLEMVCLPLHLVNLLITAPLHYPCSLCLLIPLPPAPPAPLLLPPPPSSSRTLSALVFSSCQLRHTDAAEGQATRLTDGGQAALYSDAPVLLHHAAADGVGAQLRCEAPHVSEGDAGKLTSPVDGDAHAARSCQATVAA